MTLRKDSSNLGKIKSYLEHKTNLILFGFYGLHKERITLLKVFSIKLALLRLYNFFNSENSNRVFQKGFTAYIRISVFLHTYISLGK